MEAGVSGLWYKIALSKVVGVDRFGFLTLVAFVMKELWYDRRHQG
jgi:hypothetical protein